MINVMIINGVKAVIGFDPEIEMFRGEFIGLNGGADFYAKDVDGLKREGETSLRVFLDMCAKDGVEPYRAFSGKMMFRVAPYAHQLRVYNWHKNPGKAIEAFAENSRFHVQGEIATQTNFGFFP